MALRIYTKTGDQGETGLFGGARVAKDDPRVEAIGSLDELNASLGQARALTLPAELDVIVAQVQGLLFELGAELAAEAADKHTRAAVSEVDIGALEASIDATEEKLTPLNQFILPAGSPSGAALHTCRALCRRTERRLVAMRRSSPQVSVITVAFLNRLGDLLFVLARRANQLAGVAESPWQPRAAKRK